MSPLCQNVSILYKAHTFLHVSVGNVHVRLTKHRICCGRGPHIHFKHNYPFLRVSYACKWCLRSRKRENIYSRTLFMSGRAETEMFLETARQPPTSSFSRDVNVILSLFGKTQMDTDDIINGKTRRKKSPLFSNKSDDNL